MWRKINDGWFTYYYNSNTGEKKFRQDADGGEIMSESYRFTPSEQVMLQRLKNHCKDYSAGALSCKDCPLNEVGYHCPGEIEATQSKRALYAAWEHLYGNPPEDSPTIKDSGDRTQFESGAVRDMHTGKGRYDLLPMCVIDRLAKHYEAGALKYGDRNWEKGIPAHSFADSAMRHFDKYMDGQRDEDHLIAAIWNLCGLAWTEVKRPEMMDIPARMEKEDE